MFNIQTSTLKMNETSALSEERLQFLQPTVQDPSSATIRDHLKKVDKIGYQIRQHFATTLCYIKPPRCMEATTATMQCYIMQRLLRQLLQQPTQALQPSRQRRLHCDQLQRYVTSSHQDHMEATPSAPTNSYRTSRSRRGSTRLRERGWLRLDR
jgi:hypothetical protein